MEFDNVNKVCPNTFCHMFTVTWFVFTAKAFAFFEGLLGKFVFSMSHAVKVCVYLECHIPFCFVLTLSLCILIIQALSGCC